MANSNDWITGGLFLGSIVAIGYVVSLLSKKTTKEAPAGTVDALQQSTFDERKLDYSSTVV